MTAVQPSFASQPSFATGRLRLRPRRPDDFAACHALDSDPEVVRFIDAWSDEAEHLVFLRHRLTARYPAGQGYWVIETPDGGFLGWVLLIPADAVGPETEVGWRLLRQAWGRGYATEAMRPLLRHAFVTLALPRVVADIMPANAASVGVARKLGLRPLGAAGSPVPGHRRYLLERTDYLEAA